MTEPKIIVLDDDPTGTQSVHDTTVLLQWDVQSIEEHLRNNERVFYMLTNSRALVQDEAVALATRVGNQLREALDRTGIPAIVVSRSDSTLRGHYPAEVDALAEALGSPNMPQLLVPAFLDGGRVTIDGEHYIRDQTDQLIKVSGTEFAQDATFGFSTSFLPDYIEEKTAGRIAASDVISIPVGTSRFPPLADGSVAYADISEQQHLDSLAASIINAVREGQKLLIRSAASLVPSLAGLGQGPRWKPTDIARDKGGLIVVGSYVRKSTEQLARLKEEVPEAVTAELDIQNILGGTSSQQDQTVEQLVTAIRSGQTAILSTERELVSDDDPILARNIGQQVAQALNETVRRIIGHVTPAFVIGKGGITSSDLATVSLQARSARVLGQIVAGVSVWHLDSQPKLPYVVFPGNVGGPDALLDVVRQFLDSQTVPPS